MSDGEGPLSGQTSGAALGAPSGADKPRSTTEAGLRQRRGRRIIRHERVSSWAPWLLASAVLHTLLLLVLASMRFGTPGRGEPPPIHIDTDLVEIFRTEPVTEMVQVIKMDKPVAMSGRAEQLRRALEGTGESVPVMAVESLDLSGLSHDLLARKDRTGKDPGGTGDLAGRVTTGSGRDYRAILDVLARRILDTVQRHRLLVVILFDESQSLLDDRVLVSQQLGRTFADLKFAMTDAQEKNLKWAVVSFSGDPRLWLAPTSEMEKVRQAIAKMGVNTQGKENVLKAVQYCVGELAREAERLFIVIVTDEQGDDVEKPRALEMTVDLCVRNRTRVYVLGREAMLQDASLWVYIKKLEQHGSMERGLPTCRLEVPPRIERWMRHHAYIPSGFGCYSLSLLAEKTNGQFFILSETEPKYKAQELAGYEPEWCFPQEYEVRTKQSPVRRAITDIIAEMPADMIPWWEFCDANFAQQRQNWRQRSQQLEKKIKWCDASLDRLLRLAEDVKREKFAPKRWQANWALTIAMIYRLKAILMQARVWFEELQKLPDYPRKPPPVPPGAQPKQALIYSVVLAGPRDKGARLVGGPAEKAAWERAIAALEEVQRLHRGTPWAECALVEQRHMVPVVVHFEVVDLPYPPPRAPVQHPNL